MVSSQLAIVPTSLHNVEIKVQKTKTIASYFEYSNLLAILCNYNCVVIMCAPLNLVSEVGFKTRIKERMTSEDN